MNSLKSYHLIIWVMINFYYFLNHFLFKYSIEFVKIQWNNKLKNFKSRFYLKINFIGWILDQYDWLHIGHLLIVPQLCKRQDLQKTCYCWYWIYYSKTRLHFNITMKCVEKSKIFNFTMKWVKWLQSIANILMVNRVSAKLLRSHKLWRLLSKVWRLDTSAYTAILEFGKYFISQMRGSLFEIVINNLYHDDIHQFLTFIQRIIICDITVKHLRYR
jgi:hypothetical protein